MRKRSAPKPRLKHRRAKRRLTHLDSRGRVRMVDVGDKEPVHRIAMAEGYLSAAKATLDAIMTGRLLKGDALTAARIAGIAAAKRCDELIPLCHTLPLDSAGVEFERLAPKRLRIIGTASITARTGVEMEALTAVAIAALTLYDMAKAVDKRMRIEGVRLIEKRKSSA